MSIASTPALTDDAALIHACCVVHTESGSIYRLAEQDGVGWVAQCVNVPNPDSRAVPEGWWPIETPAIPVLGHSYRIEAALSLGQDDPARMPGGGKQTSRVTQVQWTLDWAAWLHRHEERTTLPTSPFAPPRP